MKIVATADVHLGQKFSRYPSVQSQLAEERFAALERVVALANSEQADLLIVAGDLFHRVGVAAASVERAAAILAQYDGAAAVVLPGNHDYVAAEGDRLWSGLARIVGDRTVVAPRPALIDLTHYDVRASVLAAPCDSQHSTTNRLEWISTIDDLRDNGPVIGVAHGSLDGITLDSEGLYFPMTHAELGSLPASVWVVGHTHRFHWDAVNRVVVPGTPEPDGFDVPGPGTAAVIELDSNGAVSAVRSAEVGKYRFARLDVELPDEDPASADLFPADRMADLVLGAIDGGDRIVRVAVSGRLGPGSWEAWREARERVRGDDRIVQLDEEGLERRLTQPQIDQQYAKGGFAHRLLSELVADGDHDGVSATLDILDESAQ